MNAKCHFNCISMASCFITKLLFYFINGWHLHALSPPLLVIFVKQNFPIDVKYLEQSNSWCCHTIYVLRTFLFCTYNRKRRLIGCLMKP